MDRPSCTLCLIAKNEARYLLEWVAYHRLLGFDSIVVYDNRSDDGSTELLAGLAGLGVLEHRPWALGATESPQVTAYTDALRRAATDWLLFIDTDEFLVLHQHATVTEFLAAHHARPEVGLVGLNWRLFGDSGLTRYDERPVVERFTQAAAPGLAVQRLLKSFVRASLANLPARIHLFRSRGQAVHPSGRPLINSIDGRSDTIEFEVAQVNHYYGKSFEEYQDKVGRGRAGCGENRPELKFHYSDAKFHAHNQNQQADLSAQHLLPALKAEIAALRRQLPQAA